MVLMKQDERRQFLALKQQCGQERDLQVKQVENGFVIQSVIRFFIDQGEGPVSAGEVSDTTVAVSATEAGLIAKNFMQYGEFWPDGIPAEIDVPEPEKEQGEVFDPGVSSQVMATPFYASGVSAYPPTTKDDDHIMPEVRSKKKSRLDESVNQLNALEDEHG
jgi:hypothetical protein